MIDQDAGERANKGVNLEVANYVGSLGLPQDAKILDLGCGTGALLHRLSAAGFSHLTGVDIVSPRSSTGIRYFSADLDKGSLPFESGVFDLIVAVELIEHLENIGLFLNEVRRVLDVDGRLLVTTPNVQSIEARLRFLLTGRLKQFDDVDDPTHISPVFMTPFQRVAARHGFSIGRCWGFPADGSSPTSRPLVRKAAGLLRSLRLVDVMCGDNMFVELTCASEARRPKFEEITGHYS